MKFCCEGFENLYQNSDKRGFSVQFHRDSDKKMKLIFWLCLRSVDFSDEGKFKGQEDLEITISTRRSIRYCPFCGKNLNRWMMNPKRCKEVWDEVLINKTNKVWGSKGFEIDNFNINNE
ncbi:hypothetical protein AAEX28_15200 [Lentisphaerota bacterium WC36G]|nr:hypothetical protein LJT99_01970 [Lentisphaerae bacterium WC36]